MTDHTPTKDKTGGPAFPAYEHYIAMEPGKPDTVKVITGQPQGGMTLRDYAAIEFHAALLAGSLAAGVGVWSSDQAAIVARNHADAFIAQREKEGQ